MSELAIANLNKELRGRLGFPQEWLAQNVRVRFSSAGRDKNGKQRPQPLLVRRFVRLKAKLDAEQKFSKRKTE